jgi:hypothetical protein
MWSVSSKGCSWVSLRPVDSLAVLEMDDYKKVIRHGLLRLMEERTISYHKHALTLSIGPAEGNCVSDEDVG